MHFVMHAFNNHVKVLHNVTPLAQLEQVVVLSDRVVANAELEKIDSLCYRNLIINPTAAIITPVFIATTV